MNFPLRIVYLGTESGTGINYWQPKDNIIYYLKIFNYFLSNTIIWYSYFPVCDCGLKKLKVMELYWSGSNPPAAPPLCPSWDFDGSKKLVWSWFTLLASNFGGDPLPPLLPPLPPDWPCGLKKLNVMVLYLSGSKPPAAPPLGPSWDLDGSRKLVWSWLTLLGSKFGTEPPPLLPPPLLPLLPLGPLGLAWRFPTGPEYR